MFRYQQENINYYKVGRFNVRHTCRRFSRTRKIPKWINVFIFENWIKSRFTLKLILTQIFEQSPSFDVTSKARIIHSYLFIIKNLLLLEKVPIYPLRFVTFIWPFDFLLENGADLLSLLWICCSITDLHVVRFVSLIECYGRYFYKKMYITPQSLIISQLFFGSHYLKSHKEDNSTLPR